MIQIEQIRTGVIQENCYLVYNEEALLIIDPGAEGAKTNSRNYPFREETSRYFY